MDDILPQIFKLSDLIDLLKIRLINKKYLNKITNYF
jgi:hypothetical protein